MSPIKKAIKKLFCVPLLHKHKVQQASANHNMVLDPDEGFYAQQYLHWIEKTFLADKDIKTSSLLDLGCGQGRLSVPLSKLCQKIVAVDFTPKSIEFAKQYGSEQDCANIDFLLSDSLTYIKSVPSGSFDYVVFNEITFFLPDYKKVLAEIHRVLKPEGCAFISFRSQYFDILFSIQQRHWESVKTLMEKREGYLWGGVTWFSWQTTADIKEMLTEMKFKEIDCVGIGTCSGIKGDPLAHIVRPSLLEKKDQKKLLDIEIQLAHQYADQGRYILAIAKKGI